MEGIKKLVKTPPRTTLLVKTIRNIIRYTVQQHNTVVGHQKLEYTPAIEDMRYTIQLPHGEDLNEWLATNTVDFYDKICLLYAAVAEFCTPKHCPTMSAGPGCTYYWLDDTNKKRKPHKVKLNAPEYIDNLMNWVRKLLDDETIFPPSKEVPFPKNFKIVVKTIFKRLFSIFAHMYHHHAEEIVDLGIEAYLNTAFTHFYLFIEEFSLMERIDLQPLQYIIDKIKTTTPQSPNIWDHK